MIKMPKLYLGHFMHHRDINFLYVENQFYLACFLKLYPTHITIPSKGKEFYFVTDPKELKDIERCLSLNRPPTNEFQAKSLDVSQHMVDKIKKTCENHCASQIKLEEQLSDIFLNVGEKMVFGY